MLERALCSAEGIGTLARKKIPKSPGRSLDTQSEQVLQSTHAPEHEDKHIHELDLPKPISAEPNLTAQQPINLQQSALPAGDGGVSQHVTAERRKAVVRLPPPPSPSQNTCILQQRGTSPGASGGDALRAGRRNRVGPAGFASAEDLIHRLFVAISGVADQLQTNHAKDLRVILKHVFAICQSSPSAEPTCNSERHTQSAPCTTDHGSALMASSDGRCNQSHNLSTSFCVL